MSESTPRQRRPAASLFALLGKAHAMSILHVLISDDARPWRFNELRSELAVSPNTLSKRLDELRAAGLVTRTQYDEIPPRVEYAPTEKGVDLGPVFQALGEWAAAYDGDEV